MKCPATGLNSTVAFSDGNDDAEEWTEFEEHFSCDYHTSGAANSVSFPPLSVTPQGQWAGPTREKTDFETCFPPTLRSSPVALPKQRKLLTDGDTRIE